MSRIVRVSDEAYTKLNSIAKAAGVSKQDMIDAVLKKWEKDTLLKQANEAYTALRQNDQDWQEELAERALWDVTLEDGDLDE